MEYARPFCLVVHVLRIFALFSFYCSLFYCSLLFFVLCSLLFLALALQDRQSFVCS